MSKEHQCPGYEGRSVKIRPHYLDGKSPRPNRVPGLRSLCDNCQKLSDLDKKKSEHKGK